MPKYTVAKYTYIGHYDYLIRLHCKPTKDSEFNYRTWYLPKADYTLDEVKLFRNARMAELEKEGLRGTDGRRRMETSKTIGMK